MKNWNKKQNLWLQIDISVACLHYVHLSASHLNRFHAKIRGQMCSGPPPTFTLIAFTLWDSSFLHELSTACVSVVIQLLNCIMDMVEKTRRSLTVLRRCQEADREELNYWIRRYSDAEELKKGAAGGQSRQQSPAAQENTTSGRDASSHHETLAVQVECIKVPRKGR